MNPTEHAAMLRQTSALMEEAARAVERVEELEKKLELSEKHASDLQDGWKRLRVSFTRACEDRDQALRSLETVKIERDKLRAENETLARNVPPEPPSFDESFLRVTATEGSIRLGQEWCRMPSGYMPHDNLTMFHDGTFITLCNVYRNPDGSRTYEPVRISDLPELQQP